jgi:hypothetical protein
MSAIAIACSRMALFMGVALLMLATQGVFTAAVFVAALQAFHESGTVELLFVALAQGIITLATFLGAADLVRIGSVASMSVMRQLVSTLVVWTLPVGVFCIACACRQHPAVALLYQLATTMAVTALAELSNQTNDTMLIPSPGRSLSRIFGVLAVSK